MTTKPQPDEPVLEPTWRSDKAHEAICEAAEAIANHYCSEDDTYYPEVKRLTVAISNIVDSRAPAASVAPVVDSRPRIICICGSTRFIEQFAITTWELERQGHIVLGCTLLPMWYCKVPSHFGEATGTKEQCDELHLRKIDLADEVLVLNIGGYIGESTANEIAYAMQTGKPVRYLETESTTAASPAAPQEPILNTINKFRDLLPNWDSYGGRAITPEAIDIALRIAPLLPGWQPIPRSDGGIQFERGDDEICIDVGAAAAPQEAFCLLCGHKGMAPDGTCMVPVPICSDDYHGRRRCGCKCRFTAAPLPEQER